MSERTLGSNCCANGSPFHTEGPTTETAQVWLVKVQAKGTKSNSRSIERRVLTGNSLMSTACRNGMESSLSSIVSRRRAQSCFQAFGSSILLFWRRRRLLEDRANICCQSNPITIKCLKLQNNVYITLHSLNDLTFMLSLYT